MEAWTTVCALHGEGIDVRAVTAWALLGAYDWSSLLTSDAGAYECGVFDVRGAEPRATAMVPLLKSLAAGNKPDHPVLDGPGWWRREERLRYPSHDIAGAGDVRSRRGNSAVRPIVITGATGTLGQALAAACTLRSIPCVLTDRTRLSLDDPSSMDRLLDEVRPWSVVNAAGWVRVDQAENEPQACLRTNRDGSIALARACAQRGIPYATFSSDMVFDGDSERSYLEGDALGPLSIYGRSKAEADAELLSWSAGILVVRTAAFFSTADPHNFAMLLVDSLRAGRTFAAASDCSVSPTFVPDLVRTTLDLLIDGETGLWHLANDGAATWVEFADQISRALGGDGSLIEPRPAVAMGWSARRPPRAQMRSRHGVIMPSLDNAIGRFAADLRARPGLGDGSRPPPALAGLAGLKGGASCARVGCSNEVGNKEAGRCKSQIGAGKSQRNQVGPILII